MNITKFTASLTQALAPTNYSTLSNPIYKRTPVGSIIICLTGSGTIRVFQAKDNFTPTWNLNYSNQSGAFDDDLSSYAGYGVPANTSETTALTIDYNSNTERIFMIRLCGTGSYIIHRIYVSGDGVNWSLLFQTNVTTATTYVYKATFRYARITVQNTDTANTYSSILYEIAAFALVNASFTKSITYADKITFDEIQCNPYWVFAEPNPSLNLSIYERTPPSSATEIWLI
ncbi:MAG: hypothetical protein QXW58_05315 [Thermosphaera sp.]